MFAKFYEPVELIDILAAPSYAPDLVAYCKKVEGEPSLDNFLERKARLGITGTIAKDYVDPETPKAVPYVTTKQVRDLFATIEDAKFISGSADILWAKCRVDNGDIVINKSGKVGAAAILNCAPYKYANSVSDIINIKISNDHRIDKAYLVVYLNSPYGQKQLQRLSGGAIFDHVSLHAIPNINIAYFDYLAQKYIGDKVRQADLLRSRAKSLIHSIQCLIEGLIKGQISEEEIIALQQSNLAGNKNKEHELFLSLKGQYLKNNFISGPSSDSLPKDGPFIDRPTFSVKVRQEDVGNRLDAEFYEPKVLELSKSLRINGHGSLGDYDVDLIRDPYCYGFEQFDFNSNELTCYVKGEDLQNLVVSSCNSYIQREQLLHFKKVNLRKNDLIMSVRGYVGHVAVFNSDSGLPSPNTMAIRVNEEILNPFFVTAFLNSNVGLSLIRRHVSGSVQETIASNDVRSIQCYCPHKIVQDYIGEKIRLSERLKALSDALVEASRIFVDSLILRKEIEQQFILANQAIEYSDFSLDREILSRLTTNGLDVEGDRLFPDLDQFYNLLAQSQETEDQ